MSSMTPKFFGLTALGAPDSWHLNLNGTVMINIFTADDVAAAYKRTARIEGKAKGAVLGDFLTELYRGEYPPVELQRLKEIVSQSVPNSSGEFVAPEDFDELVGLAVLEDAVEQLKQVAEEQVTDSVYSMGSGSEHASNALFRAHRFKHTRLKEGPEAKYAKPATASQEVIQTHTSHSSKNDSSEIPLTFHFAQSSLIYCPPGLFMWLNCLVRLV